MLRKATYSDFDEILNLTSRVFVKHEPMLSKLNVSESEFSICFSPIISECCWSEFSYVYQEWNHNISAVSLAIPYNVYQDIEFTILDSIKPVMSVLDTLETMSKENIDFDDTIYTFIICTDPDHVNKGRSKMVIEATEHTALKYKYNMMVTDATNVISQNIFMKHFDYEPMCAVDYTEFPCFKDISETKGAIRLCKKFA